MNIQTRFWDKVKIGSDNDCWSWSAYVKPNGYGQFRLPNGSILSHRFAFESKFGPIPTDLMVCHKCDNRSCVNPSHLFLGTAKDNSLDMVNKDRGNFKRGGKHPNAKLTQTQVLSIRNDKRKQREIALEYNVSISSVSLIQNKINWK